MNNFQANNLLKIIQHRDDWAVPEKKWLWYQEWNKVLFFHWKIEAALLADLIPDTVQLDTYNNEAWVSLVAFTMEHVRPRHLSAVSLVSDFHEVNLRTYVTDGQHHGVYFLSMEAEKFLSTLIARELSGMPYEKASLARSLGYLSTYNAKNHFTENYLKVDYRVGEQLTEKSALDKWLTERYYVYNKTGDKTYKYSVHHPEWNLFNLKTANLQLSYNIGALSLSADNIEMVHYADGVQVVAWPRETIK
jgi:uncharacterized protein YqjF (DUF2071 family)